MKLMPIWKVHVEAVILSEAKDLGEILRSAQNDDLIHMHFPDRHYETIQIILKRIREI